MKFGASTCMRQSPVFMSLASNSPFFFVVTEKPEFTSAKTNVTFAPATGLPASSTTLPLSEASPFHGGGPCAARSACWPRP